MDDELPVTLRGYYERYTAKLRVLLAVIEDDRTPDDVRSTLRGVMWRVLQHIRAELEN